MTKNTRTRILLVAVASLLLVTMAVGGTIAWLQDSTEEVKNTFTVSNIDIEIDEHKYNGTDTLGTEVVKANENYKMVPGDTLPKDPYVTVKSGSEKCYVFVQIMESANLDSFISYEVAGTWTKVEENVYMYSTVVDAMSADQVLPILKDNQVKVLGGVTDEMMHDEDYTNPTLAFKAYAVQSENLPEGLTNAQLWQFAQTGTLPTT